jgi:hypothetical protein
MNTYQLDDKATDQEFLDGKTVRCKATVKESDSAALTNGSRIVVLLSNGKKYMGEIVSFTYTVKKGHADGTMELIRFPRQIISV